MKVQYGSSIDISSEKVQTSKQNSTEDKFAAYADYSKQVDDMTAKLIRYRGKVLKVINQVDNKTYKMLLIERYMKCHTWEQVAESIGLKDVRHVYRLHKKSAEKYTKYHNKQKRRLILR